MPSSQFFTVKHKDSPLKVHAKKVTNVGRYDVYLFTINDDLPLGLAQLMAYSSVVLAPGDSLEIEKSPFFNGFGIPGEDFDICIHADPVVPEIDVHVISDKPADDWIYNIYHPWNGHQLLTGGFTEKYKAIGGILLPPSIGNLGLSPNNQLSAVNNGYNSVPPKIVGSWVVYPQDGIDYISVNITVDGPKCECGKEKHGFTSHSSWCELAK